MVAAHLMASRQLLVNVALSCSCPMAPALLSAMRTSLLRLVQRSLAVALVMLTMTPWALPLGLVTAVQTVLQHLQRHAVPWPAVLLSSNSAMASDALTASNPFVNGTSENPKITYESQVINQVEYVSHCPSANDERPSCQTWRADG